MAAPQHRELHPPIPFVTDRQVQQRCEFSLKRRFRTPALGYFRLDQIPNQAPGTFYEHQIVG
jgi:hypothetical protein